ncbi:type II toxin-antitoxin system VapC family toxin [Glycomyces arizonensis]|uniref:type II toxin-antitoxin system VapC family toxin n=1 Tax=Glycomyces arizonensis TaxID=256035 RepID=UPI00041782B8|nr:type II toxin-antitoxin system VapC family toxin [Glycomyces arizonensis]
MITVDASALIRALTDDRELGNKARGALSMHEQWVAPGHLTAEFCHGLRGMVMGNKIDQERAEWALREYFDLDLQLIIPDASAVECVWKLRHNLSAYDALYVAVAEQLGTPLLTADARIERSGMAQCEVTTLRSGE